MPVPSQVKQNILFFDKIFPAWLISEDHRLAIYTKIYICVGIWVLEKTCSVARVR